MKKAVLILSTIILLFPIYWMIAGSFMELDAIMALPPRLVPFPLFFDNYAFYFGSVAGLRGNTADPLLRPNIGRWVGNTALLVAMSAFGAVVVTFMAAYSLAYLPWRGKQAAFWFFLAGMVVPANVLFVARFVTFWHLGLVGTRAAMVLTYLVGPVNILICRHYLKTMPAALRDAAKLDGCGEFRTLFSVILPVAQPVLGMVALFTSMGVMNDYLWQMLMSSDVTKETLLVGILRLQIRLLSVGEHINGIGVSLAGGVLLMLPLLLVFMFCQRYFTGGLTIGAIRD